MIGNRVRRVELDHLIEVGDGAIIGAFRQLGIATRIERTALIGIEPERVVEVGKSAVQVAAPSTTRIRFPSPW